MKESVFNMHHVDIQLNSLNDKFVIYPVSDVHRETPLCDVDRWKGFLAHTKQEIADGQQTYFIGIGDWNDFAAWGDRKKLRNASLHESTIIRLDEGALRDQQSIVDELAFTKDRWVGMIQGNHRWEYTLLPDMEGMSSEDYYAEQLNTRNLGDAAYIRLSVSFKTKPSMSRKIDIVTYHGKAGGKLAGTTINQVDDLKRVFPEADIYITGHDHRKVAVPTTTLWASSQKKGNMKLTQKRQWLMRSGSFLRGYVEGESSYIVRKMLAPTDLGVVKIKCGFKRDQRDGDDRTVNDIHVEY